MQVWVRELAAALMDMGNKHNPTVQASVEELVLAGVSPCFLFGVLCAEHIHPARTFKQTITQSLSLRVAPDRIRALCSSLEDNHCHMR